MDNNDERMKEALRALYDKYYGPSNRLLINYGNATISNINSSKYSLIDDSVRNYCISEVPRALPENQQIAFGLVYPLVFMTAVTGNILVLFVVLSNKEMQSVTNIFIANLAASDLLVNFTCLWLTPLYIHLNQWIWGTIMCYCLPLFQGIATFNSTLTLMAIAIDRYIVILHPFRPRISKSFSLAVIFSIWMLSFLLVFPYAKNMQTIPLNRNQAKRNESLFCDDTCELCLEQWGWEQMRAVYGAASLILQFVIPFSTSAFCYFMIWRRINNRHNMSMAQSSNTEAEVARKRRLLTMLIAMVVVFASCFLPIQSLNIYRDLGFPGASSAFVQDNFYAVFLSVHVISMSATCWNPILFAWLNENFQREFKAVLPCFSGNRVHRAFSIRNRAPLASAENHKSVTLMNSGQHQQRPAAETQQTNGFNTKLIVLVSNDALLINKAEEAHPNKNGFHHKHKDQHDNHVGLARIQSDNINGESDNSQTTVFDNPHNQQYQMATMSSLPERTGDSNDSQCPILPSNLHRNGCSDSVNNTNVDDAEDDSYYPRMIPTTGTSVSFVNDADVDGQFLSSNPDLLLEDMQSTVQHRPPFVAQRSAITTTTKGHQHFLSSINETGDLRHFTSKDDDFANYRPLGDVSKHGSDVLL